MLDDCGLLSHRRHGALQFRGLGRICDGAARRLLHGGAGATLIGTVKCYLQCEETRCVLANLSPSQLFIYPIAIL